MFLCMESPGLSTKTTPDFGFQLSLLRILAPGQAPTQQIEQVEELLTQALAVG
jgi:hypothetical protein